MNLRAVWIFVGLLANVHAQADVAPKADAPAVAAADLAAALAVLRDGTDAERAALALRMRHTWPTLPEEVAEALLADPLAARPLARELGAAPRPSWRGLAERMLRDPRVAGDDRALWLAARNEPLTTKEAAELLDVLLAGNADDGVYAAFGALPAAVADAMVGRIHAALLGGAVDVVSVTPWFDRMSAAGKGRLLGLAVALPKEIAVDVCQYVIDAAPAEYDARATAALDGKAPIERLWLQKSAHLVRGVPERQTRVAAVLGDDQADAELRRAAFMTLVDAGFVAAEVLDYAERQLDDGEERHSLRRLLDVAVDLIPPERLVTWLRGAPDVSAMTLAALGQRSDLQPALLAALLEPIRDAGGVYGLWTERAALVLAARAPRQTLVDSWSLLRTAPDILLVTEAIADREDAQLADLLARELAGSPAAGAEDSVAIGREAALRLALARLGDSSQVGALVGMAARLKPALLRRCRSHGLRLDAAQARTLAEAARGSQNFALAGEMFDWAATCTDPALVPYWRELLDAGDAAAGEEAALRALCSGAERAALRERLRAQLRAGKLDERDETLRYELVASLPEPATADDLRLLAELALLAPLAEPEAEAERAERWPDGAHGFPFVSSIAVALRAGDPAGVHAAFAAVAAEVEAHPRREALSRQGVLVLWRALEPTPQLQTAVGTATAGCFARLPGTLGGGPAAWYRHLEAVDRGDLTTAVAAAEVARDELLLNPTHRRDVRMFVGERDPANGYDPWAALAAAPALLRAKAAAAASQGMAARRWLAAAEDLAGRDVVTHQEIARLRETLQ